jgi:fatty-acyl-CoA synthase
VAFVVLRPDKVTSRESLMEHCRAQLARYKVPREVTFLDTLPRTPSGKVLKRELRDR